MKRPPEVKRMLSTHPTSGGYSERKEVYQKALEAAIPESRHPLVFGLQPRATPQSEAVQEWM
jgi:hypothetical protein